MTSPVSQTISADNTKNTKDNRKIVVASYFRCQSIFKIPDNLDLQDTTIVEDWWVKYNELHIHYTTRENYILYAKTEPFKKEVRTKTETGFITIEEDDLTQEIQLCEETDPDYKYPEEQEIADAEDYSVEYEEDEEKEEEKEKEEDKVEEKEEEKVEVKEEEQSAVFTYKVTDVQFPRDNDYEEPDPSMRELVMDRIWEANDEEHLWDVISDEVGWLCEGVCERVI